MRYIRFVTTALAAGALVFAAGCKSTTSTTTTTTTTPSSMSSSNDNGTTSYGNTGTTSSTSYNNSGTTSSTTSTTSTSLTPVTSSTTINNGTAQTVTNPDGSTTTVLPNGNTVTQAQTTTVVYPNGTVQNMPANGSTTVNTANGTVPAVPPGAAVVTKTTTTITTTPGTQQVAQVPQPIYITTTPANVYANNPPPSMTSSTTTIYQPYRSGRARRFPGFNLLVFADRASFSSNNSSLNGTVNTGQFGSDIRNENGWGGGINMYLGRTNLSTEFTYSSIQPRATFTPTNTAFQPITNYRFKMQPITGTLQLHFNPRSSVDAYIGGGGAYVRFKPSGSFNAGNTGLTGLSFRNEWGPLVNAGIGFGFSPNFGLNFDAKYMWVRANATPTFNNVTIGNVGNTSRIGVNPFIVSAGLRFGF